MLKASNKLKTGGQIVLIPHESIAPNPNQPRRRFDYDELEGLAQSIRSSGMLQPINVRMLDPEHYELISGERRLRAARLVGMSCVPCIIMEASEQKSALFALIENIQRENLDFFEEAVGIERLMSEFSMSQEEMAKKLGKSQSAISNKLRLLRLTESMREQITAAGLTERHARALLRLEDNTLRARALGIMTERHLNVAESEKLINQMLRRTHSEKKPPIKVFRDVRIFINTLNHAVDTMRRAGIEADSAKSETEEYIEYIVRIPKPEDKGIREVPPPSYDEVG
ncbi:MAG: ParB/RepB/Spo0J family partition protein [Clostridiales bacterium]|nr:ParB/RepB/Spo0J family partition protein [Clostridiales bacterium]